MPAIRTEGLRGEKGEEACLGFCNLCFNKLAKI